MPKQNSKNNNNGQTTKKKIKPADFFAMVDTPTAEAKRFSRYVKGPSKQEIVSDSLSELYADDNGERVDVSEVTIKRRRSWWLRLFLLLIYCAVAAAIGGGVWYWLTHRAAKASPLDVTITADSGLIANQEFTYTINYQNKENKTLTNVELTAVYPDNFVTVDSSPQPSVNNNKWRLSDIKPFGSGNVQIKGRLIGRSGQSNILFVDVTYQLEGISSSFKKTTSFDSILTSSGLEVMTTAPGSLLVGEEKTLEVSWLPQEKNYLETFTLRLETSSNINVKGPKDLPEGVTEDSSVWKIDPKQTAKTLPLTIKALDKSDKPEEIKLLFEYQPSDSDKTFVIEEKVLEIEIVKNSLNLSLSVNGQTSDQGVDFDQMISYSLSYENKGETSMNNVIISAVLEGDALDWRKLEDENNGKVVGSSIIWTSTEVPALQSLTKNQQGTIDFLIPVRSSSNAKLINNFEIKNYAQFSLTDATETTTAETDANRSNQIILKVNSDVNLDEAVRYFDEDNIAVGTGPLPPKVGDTTTLKTYWTITNSLHELGNLKVTTTLPSGVTWNDKDIVSVGTLQYNPDTNQVVWDIGRLPLSAPKITAEFSIALKPRSADQGRLMILAAGTNLTAQDNQTTYFINKELKSQTTKLEKDDIANTDGIVR